MQRFLPLLMSCLNIILSRTELIGFRTLGLNDNMSKTYWNKGFPKIDGTIGNRHLQLQTTVRDHYKINKKNDKCQKLRGRLNDFYDNVLQNFGTGQSTDSINGLTTIELNYMSTLLTTLLNQQTWMAPLVIVNEAPFPTESDGTELESSDELQLRPNVFKRTRYYRRYPYKRQNPRYQNGYDYDGVYVCTPTRDDIFQLLIALHDLRQGEKSQHINFCNRRRTTRTLLTHMRFLGRRK
ncbi:uncharacterized protein [Venturia canescens]|uniref:uncharacterized protein isoform X3 n=1 Tax=Venturia canescens TaxID=32260 RepID=UPI001C9D5AC7|nr:uncharacterized protein LOC122408304 isoform X3 [Venturia canescens]